MTGSGRQARSSQPRLVATDLDGTLLHSDGRVTPRTRDVLRALDRQGVPVVFTTGRPIRWMRDLWHHVGSHGLAICSNGGIVYDVGAQAVREVMAVPRDVGLQVAEMLREAVPGTAFGLENTRGWVAEPEFPTHPDDNTGRRRQGALVDVFGDDVAKVLAVHPTMDPEEFWRRVEATVGHLVTTTWSSTFALVEISAAGVTKASTLAVLAEELGVTAAEVVAFGDMPNDVAMLEWAGHAVAMGNAHPSLREHADRVAPSNDEDGVASVLEELFGLGR